MSWNSREFGAPGIDPKRPYGNSNPHEDIAEVLGEGLFETAGGEERVSADQAERFDELHEELETALQVVLDTAGFEPGVYEREKYGGRWSRVDEGGPGE